MCIISSLNWKLLWENPSLENEFSEQYIDVDLSEYKIFAVKYTIAKNINRGLFAFAHINEMSVMFSYAYSNSVRLRTREFTLYSEKMYFSNALENGVVDNTMCIPTAIYGISK